VIRVIQRASPADVESISSECVGECDRTPAHAKPAFPLVK
jgi:hypothetical protein